MHTITCEIFDWKLHFVGKYLFLVQLLCFVGFAFFLKLSTFQLYFEDIDFFFFLNLKNLMRAKKSDMDG